MSSGELHLIFDAGGRTFAVPGSRVVEIVRYAEGSTDFVSADLSSILGGPPACIGPQTCVVVVGVDRAGMRQSVGLIIDAATDTVTVPANELVIPDFGPRIHPPYLSALARVNDTLSIVLDVDGLLSDLIEEREGT